MVQKWSWGHKARGQGYKKIRGQGPTSREHTLSRPRTGIFEAKDKILRVIFQKKKVFAQKNRKFLGVLQSKEKVFAKKFRKVSDIFQKKRSS